MEPEERTRDIYEQLPFYPKPPLPPLPEPGDLQSLEGIGLRLTPFSRALVRTMGRLTGFHRFQQHLPGRLESVLRRTELRGGGLYAPVISATLALADDPRGIDPFSRAATLLFAARSLYDDLQTGRLPPDQSHGEPLEMGQYPNLFSTCLIVEGRRARMYKSKTITRVAVAVAQRLYILNIGDLGQETSFECLRDSLAALTEAAQREPHKDGEPAPGWLTCGGHLTQLKIFTRMQRNEINRQSLHALRNCFLTLCLDLDTHPTGDADAASLAHMGNPGNRWYHASLQLVVFGNAKACAICNFSAYLDGNTMMRGAAELQARAALLPVVSGPLSLAGQRDTQGLAVSELHWQIQPQWLHQAQEDFRQVQDHQPATFDLPGYGKEFFAALGAAPVPTFILSLELAARRLTGRTPRVTQFLAMSRYRCMDLLTAVVTTPEVERCVDELLKDDLEPVQAKASLQAAVASQQEAIRRVRQALPLDELMALYTGTLRPFRAMGVYLFQQSIFGILRRLSLFQPVGREIIVSHPEIYPQVPVVGRPGARLPYVRDFGLHYQIMEDRLVLTWMPGVNWTVSNAELVKILVESLEWLRARLSGQYETQPPA